MSNPYDLVSYPGYTHPQTHPDRLAVIGLLFGMQPKEIGECRVLELGCGNGSNVVPMAWSLPRSDFVGIDLAQQPIEAGQGLARDAGVSNVDLRQGSVMEIDPAWGTFDYIIAHGLFSWVPAPVRTKILRICQECLAPQGIAFVSYNALPGGHLRAMLREMLLFHVRGFTTAQERIEQATSFSRFLAEHADNRSESGCCLRAEAQAVREHDPGHLYHDELAEISEPFYFAQFLSQAAAHELQYLGESDFFEMSDQGLSEEARKQLEQLSRKRVLREQYLDFLKCRRFRQTLLCRAEVALGNEPSEEVLGRMRVASNAKCEGEPSMQPGRRNCFVGKKGTRIETDFLPGKAALLTLGECGYDGLPFDELCATALERCHAAGWSDPPEKARQSLVAFLFRLYSSGMIDLGTARRPGIAEVSERPSTSPVARVQARNGNWVTNRFHVAVQLEDEIGRELLLLLDGTRDKATIASDLMRVLQIRNLMPADGSADFELFRKHLNENLQKLARIGLLVS